MILVNSEIVHKYDLFSTNQIKKHSLTLHDSLHDCHKTDLNGTKEFPHKIRYNRRKWSLTNVTML